MSAHCHKMVAKVAQEAAGQLYETLMGSSNQIYAEWKRQNPGLSEKALRVRFIAKNWGRLLPFARATLARLLAQPLDESAKEEIMEALTLDATLRRGRPDLQRIGVL